MSASASRTPQRYFGFFVSPARRAVVSVAELEVPGAPRRAFVVWAEAEFPDVSVRRAFVAYAEAQYPDAPRRAVVSYAVFQVPSPGETTSGGNPTISLSRPLLLRL